MKRLLLTAVVCVSGLLAPASAQSADTVAVPADTVVVPLDSLLGAHVRENGLFEDLDALVDWYYSAEPKQLAVGESPAQNPGEAGSMWVLGADSTVWIQPSEGEPYQADAYTLWLLGDTVGWRLGYSDDDHDPFGYGYEDGRLYLYVTQSAPVVAVVLALLLAVVLVVFGVYRLWRALQHSREQERRLAESKRRLADSREEERLSLARDLHDGPLQDIQALRMQLGVAERRERRDGADATASRGLAVAVGQVQEELLRVGAELREISEGLRPPVLGSFGLAPAIRALVDRLRATHPDLTVEQQFSDEGQHLSDAVRLALYRVVQEAVNNAIEHAQATTVRIDYASDAGAEARLTVTDDGAGFDVPADLHDFERDGHLGLAGMAERAEALGGRLHIQSKPGQTTIEMTLPLQPETV